jgi:hypothetical protein
VKLPLPPRRVIPAELSPVVASLPYWFVIGGHAVRCLCPYRPSRDVDFGVQNAKDLGQLLHQLERSGTIELLERSPDTIHLRWNGINVSIFLLDMLAPFTEQQRLTVDGILATKLHAILDRGTRRDFFDLYVTLQTQSLGIASCLSAMRTVYGAAVSDSLLLRALSYFEDAEGEAPLPGEGEADFDALKTYFLTCVGQLIAPPVKALAIQRHRVDVLPE